jgi:hypothetical protein
MADRILTARDYAIAEGCSGVLERIRKWATVRGLAVVGNQAEGAAVTAQINRGRWIARCPDCGNAEAVDPDEPVFYCLNCGNITNGRKYRPVDFPGERADIEEVMLSREVLELPGANPIEVAMKAIPLAEERSWTADKDISGELEAIRLAKQPEQEDPEPVKEDPAPVDEAQADVKPSEEEPHGRSI